MDKMTLSERIEFWIEDSGNRWFSILAVIIMVASLVSATIFAVLPRSHASSEIAQRGISLTKTFTSLNEQVVTQTNDKKGIEIQEDLYLKEPFIDEQGLRSQLYELNELLLKKFNKSKDGSYVRLIRYNIYDRKIVYDKDLKPRVEAYYGMDPNSAFEEDAKNVEKTSDALNPNATKEETKDTVSEIQGSQQSIVLSATDKEKGKPDYDKYVLEISSFIPYKPENAKYALTDQEFAFYLKLQLYKAIGGSTSAATRLYIQWDLGKPLTDKNNLDISRQFEDFVDRENKIGNNTNYYSNVPLLKQQLAIYKPQFLLFALTNEYVSKREDAQKKLTELDSNLYSKAIKNHLQSVNTSTNDYDGIEIDKGDPFNGFEGENKAEEQTFIKKNGGNIIIKKPQFSIN